MAESTAGGSGDSGDKKGFSLLTQFLSDEARASRVTENVEDIVDISKEHVISDMTTTPIEDVVSEGHLQGDREDAVLRVIPVERSGSELGVHVPENEQPSPGFDDESSDEVMESNERSSDNDKLFRELPRVIAIANQKGGVGKTTTTINLGACLAELGYRTLIVDLDPQANATTGLGIGAHELEESMYDVILSETPMEDCVEATSVKNLFIAPASLDLAGAEIELVPAMSREHRLKRAIGDVVDDYDFVLIDCPPSLGLLTVNALAAAAEVLVPIQCEYFALEGLGQLIHNVDLVKRNLNPDIELSTIVLVMYDARTKLAEQVAQEVRDHFGDKVLSHVVPRTVRLSEAPSFGQPIIMFDPSSRGAVAYREIAMEVSGGAPKRAG